MIWKNAFKYPVLAIGVLFFVIYLLDPKTKEFWGSKQSRFIPNTCEAILDRLRPNAPKDWDLNCPGTSRLVLKVPYAGDPKDQKNQRSQMYKLLANTLVSLGKMTNKETMEYMQVVEVYIMHDLFSIKSKTDGTAVVEIARKKTNEDIANHLKLTVKVKEFTE